MTFLWGVNDATVNTHCFEMLGFEFDNNSEPYSVFNLGQSMGVVFFNLIETKVETKKERLIYVMFLCLIGMFCCGITYFFDYRDKKSSNLNRTN
jgi:hypothetical protein